MKCIAPIWITETSDTAGTYVPCGRCYACIQTKRSVWTFRILMELRVAESAYFITLTYDPESVPLTIQYNRFTVQTLRREHLKLFLKRLRQRIIKDHGKNIRWLKQSPKTQKWSPRLRLFACGEYGEKTARPHYHLVLFNMPISYIKEDKIHGKLYSTDLESIWGHGRIDIGNVERGSAHYMTKYHMFPLVSPWNNTDAREKPFSSMTRNPGIGYNYAIDGNTKNYYSNTKHSYATLKNGIKTPLGRYLKEKIYTEQEDILANRIQASEYAIKAEKLERDSFASEADYLRAKREEHKEGIKKFKRTNLKNNSL